MTTADRHDRSRTEAGQFFLTWRHDPMNDRRMRADKVGSVPMGNNQGPSQTDEFFHCRLRKLEGVANIVRLVPEHNIVQVGRRFDS
jgi:hypothetical protein